MYLGIDIGGTKCAVVLGNEKGEILRKVRFETMDKDSTIEKLIEIAREMGEFQSIGISCGGPLDSKKGVIMSPPNLVGWDNVPVCEILKNEFPVPVYLCNDANGRNGKSNRSNQCRGKRSRKGIFQIFCGFRYGVRHQGRSGNEGGKLCRHIPILVKIGALLSHDQNGGCRKKRRRPFTDDFQQRGKFRNGKRENIFRFGKPRKGG